MSLLEFHQTLQTYSYLQDIFNKEKSKGSGPILLELFPFVIPNGFYIRYINSLIVCLHNVINCLILCLNNVVTLNICMKEFGSIKKILCSYDKFSLIWLLYGFLYALCLHVAINFHHSFC